VGHNLYSAIIGRVALRVAKRCFALELGIVG
jgi:hypothetical protein